MPDFEAQLRGGSISAAQADHIETQDNPYSDDTRDAVIENPWQSSSYMALVCAKASLEHIRARFRMRVNGKG